jgi:hypothetical protein
MPTTENYQNTTWWSQPPPADVSSLGYSEMALPICDPSVYGMTEVAATTYAITVPTYTHNQFASSCSSEVSTVFTPDVGPNPMAASSLLAAAPQPAHFSAGPSLPQANRMPRYERVFVHDLPPTLPAPPMVGASPVQYPSQEEVIGPRRRKDQQQVHELSEKEAIKNWQRQFDQRRLTATTAALVRKQDSSTSAAEVTLKPKNIPFASPYIQTDVGSTDESKDDLAAKEFDPSKPPPTLKKNS